MIRKLALLGGLATVLALGLIAGGGTPTKAFVRPGIQDFNVDMVNCLLPSYDGSPASDTVSPDPLGALPMSCKAGEAKGVDPGPNKSVSLGTAINLPPGDRLGYPYVYNGPGPVLLDDTQIPDGTQVGDVVSVVDLYQDGFVDVMADSTNCGGPPNSCGTALTFANATPEQYVKQGLVFGPGTGCPKPGGLKDDETYLNSLMPGADAMTRYVRYQACIDTVYLQGKYRVDVILANGSPTPLNLVTLSPNWSPAGTHVNLVALSEIADKASPSTAILGLDSPQSSLSHTNAPYAANASVPGLYAHWMTEISAADQADGALNFVYSTSCKAIGGNFPDADADCYADANESPSTCNGTANPPQTLSGNIDSDGDGLLDGVEVAWGSNPCLADTDGDGRTDLEEMVGPTQFLSDPTKQDTDGDTVLDGGLTLDANGDGAPDFPDEDGDGVVDAGKTVVSSEADGSSHVRVGYKIVGTDILADNPNSIEFERRAGTDSANDVEITLTRDPLSTTIVKVTAGDGRKAGGAASGCPVLPGVLIGSTATTETWKVTWPSPCDVEVGDTIVISVFWMGIAPTLDGITWTKDNNPIGTEPAGDFPLPLGGRDNCPSIDNGAAEDNQVNTDLDTATTWGHGDLFGNACDTDDDNDGIVDTAELGFQYDQGAHQCSNDPDLPGAATPLNPLNPDSDGDGVIDGVECEVGSNPIDASDSPGAPGASDDPDQDGVSNKYETFKRTQSFSNQPAPAPVGNEDVDNDQGGAGGACDLAGNCGQADPDSDHDGLSDGCEAYVTGTHPLRPDSDGNGTADASEPNLTARIAAYCKSATDLDGDGVKNDVDNCLFVANAAQTNTDPTIGNGKGITGDDSTVPWSVKSDKRGNACDGDLDNDGLPNASDSEPGGPGADITYDDNNDGTWKGANDDGPSWDITPAIGNGRLDGREAVCAGSFSDMPAGWVSADSDGDGLPNKWEFCKWGSSPNRWDSDGDSPSAPSKTKGDCVEAADVDGNGNVDFTGDVMLYAQAILLSPASFGQDGDFDIDANNNLDFTGDVMMEAQFGLIGTPGTSTGICH